MAGSRRSLGRTRQDVEGLRVLLCSNIFGTGFLFGRPGCPSVWGVYRNGTADIMSVILFRPSSFEQTDHSRDRAMPTPVLLGTRVSYQRDVRLGTRPDRRSLACRTGPSSRCGSSTTAIGDQLCGGRPDFRCRRESHIGDSFSINTDGVALIRHVHRHRSPLGRPLRQSLGELQARLSTNVRDVRARIFNRDGTAFDRGGDGWHEGLPGQ